MRLMPEAPAKTESAEALDLSRQMFRPRAVADPYPTYARLREIGAVVPIHLPGFASMYLVTSFAECSQLLRDNRFGPLRAEDLDAMDPAWQEHPFKRRMFRSMAFHMDADHRVRRAAVAKHFTPRKTAERRREIAAIVEMLLDRLTGLGADGAPVDIEETLAVPFSSLVFGRLIGMSDTQALQLGNRQLGALFELACLPVQRRRTLEAGEELDRQLSTLIQERRRRPQDDLLSDLVRQHGPNDEELASDVLLTFVAGFDSPASLVGLGTQLFLDHPDQARALRDNPQIAAGTVEEILRYEPPVQVMTRVARTDVELAGVTIAAGSTLRGLVAGANRDPAYVSDPDRFDVRRTPRPGLSFGGGPHYCLGAAIARLQGELLFPALLRRFPRMQSAGPPRFRSPGSFLRGFEHLPVRLMPA